MVTMTLASCFCRRRLRPRYFSTFSDSHFLEGTKIYSQMKGDTCMPIGFSVPSDDPQWPSHLKSYPLGQHAARIRREFRDAKLTPTLYEQLKRLDFAFDIPHYLFYGKFIPALQRYKHVYGTTLVPQRFAVPSDENWPRQCWNMNLGRKVNAARLMFKSSQGHDDRIEALKALGLVWDVADEEFHQFVYPALVLYRKLHGNLLVPTRFSIPDSDPWPKFMWGRKLGRKVGSLRQNRYVESQAHIDKLDSIGMVWNVAEYEFTNKIVPCLNVFFRLHGHIKISPSFVVPDRSGHWDAALAGYRLGSVWKSIQHRSQFAPLVQQHRKELEKMGYCDRRSPELKVQRQRRYLSNDDIDAIVQLFPIFVKTFKTKSIPAGFRVPSTSDWPSRYHAYALYTQSCKISKAYAAGELSDSHVQQMVQVGLGHRLDHFKFRVYRALEEYKGHFGNLHVPIRFRIPLHDSSWPSSLHGFVLGGAVRDLRRRGRQGLSSDQVEVLDQLGFVWDPATQFWSESLMPVLRLYKKLYGHVHIPLTFTVPSQTPWPQDLHGYHLGRAVMHVKQRLWYRDQVKENAEELERIGFRL